VNVEVDLAKELLTIFVFTYKASVREGCANVLVKRLPSTLSANRWQTVNFVSKSLLIPFVSRFYSVVFTSSSVSIVLGSSLLSIAFRIGYAFAAKMREFDFGTMEIIKGRKE
jgi:hypothetical protein